MASWPLIDEGPPLSHTPPILPRTNLPPACSHRSSKPPPAFRSAGVVDLSDPNDVGRRSTVHAAPAPPTAAAAAPGAPDMHTPSGPQPEELTGASLQGCQQHVLWPRPAASRAAHSRGAHGHGGRVDADDLGVGSQGRGAVSYEGLHPGSDHLALEPGERGGGGSGVVVLGPRQARRVAADRRLASGAHGLWASFAVRECARET
eukprot:scaffold249551_cov21-Tisochrysis_lutea.AAC.1